MTKDEDFLDLSVTRGCPPKVVCLAIGNASNAVTAILLLQRPDDDPAQADQSIHSTSEMPRKSLSMVCSLAW